MLYTSINNDKIKNIKKLKIKKYRIDEFLVEGEHLVMEAYKAGYLKELLLLEGTELKIDVPTSYVSSNVMKYITELETPNNVIGIVKKLDKKELGNRILILDEIRDPGNLGTIIRSSVAFNIDTIIIGDNSVDLYNSKVIRASEGMIFHINIINEDLRKFIPLLKEKDYKIVGTKLTNGKSVKTLEKNKKLCIIMGNEGQGVSSDIFNMCDEYVYIPMSSKCESLNVGVATSIILYELSR